MAPFEYIAGREKLTEVFGEWPSFHDAEVTEVRLARDDGVFSGGTVQLFATVHVFAFGDQTPEGQFVFKNHSLVTIRFGGVEDLDLREFNHQNAILGLEIEVRPGARPDSKNFRVIFEPAHGMGCEFLCSEIEVASVEAGMPSLSAYA